MKNKNKANAISSSQNNSNSNPFPKLKPKGSIILKELPKYSEKNKSNEEKKENSFLSKLKIFDPNPKIVSNNNIIKHSKTLDPSLFDNYSNKNNNNENKEKGNDVNNTNKENQRLSYKKTDINEDKKDTKDIKDIKDPKRLSLKKNLDSAKIFFRGLGGYVNKNFISKINLNFIKSNKEKNENSSNDLGINFEKPANYAEIEKFWNNQKLLLNFNILDLTSKLY